MDLTQLIQQLTSSLTPIGAAVAALILLTLNFLTGLAGAVRSGTLQTEYIPGFLSKRVQPLSIAGATLAAAYGADFSARYVDANLAILAAGLFAFASAGFLAIAASVLPDIARNTIEIATAESTESRAISREVSTTDASGVGAA